MCRARRHRATNHSNASETSAGRQARASSQCRRGAVFRVRVWPSNRTRIAERQTQIKFFSGAMRGRVKSFPMATSSRLWRKNLPTAVAGWGCVVSLGVFLGLRLGYGEPRFAIALGVAAALFAFEFLLSAPAVLAKVRDWLG